MGVATLHTAVRGAALTGLPNRDTRPDRSIESPVLHLPSSGCCVVGMSTVEGCPSSPRRSRSSSAIREWKGAYWLSPPWRDLNDIQVSESISYSGRRDSLKSWDDELYVSPQRVSQKHIKQKQPVQEISSPAEKIIAVR